MMVLVSISSVHLDEDRTKKNNNNLGYNHEVYLHVIICVTLRNCCDSCSRKFNTESRDAGGFRVLMVESGKNSKSFEVGLFEEL